jgi:hypothetical protein
MNAASDIGGAAELLDQVVRASEDTILVIDRNLAKILEQQGILSARLLPTRLQDPAEFLEVHLLLFDRLAEHPAQELRRHGGTRIRPDRRVDRVCDHLAGAAKPGAMRTCQRP